MLRDAGERLRNAREIVWSRLCKFSAIILQPAPTAAPAGLHATGSADYQIPWTVFGGPLVVVPGGFSSKRLPLAVMVGAAPGQDSVAFDVAELLAQHFDTLPEAAGGVWSELFVGVSQ